MFLVSMWLLYTSDSGDWSLTDVAGIKAGGTVNIMAVIHWHTATTTIEILNREREREGNGLWLEETVSLLMMIMCYTHFTKQLHN